MKPDYRLFFEAWITKQKVSNNILNGIQTLTQLGLKA